ncbi:hypothetical protein [Photobacterium rosenbergii]|uniref:Uncharacterized protein n=1 Tax=Photobacterium rosenbergii TaxID=294936 RepID=A0ABU3ZJX7_9GAMM|nr:hypothetical protein [Photobacterium rosenbergii]MDV5170416.1 hypothetical protein [Photobacterium rosenbergii]
MAFIDKDFQAPDEASPYSGEFMTELFEYSHGKMKEGKAWQALPPSLPDFYQVDTGELSAN